MDIIFLITKYYEPVITILIICILSLAITKIVVSLKESILDKILFIQCSAILVIFAFVIVDGRFYKDFNMHNSAHREILLLCVLGLLASTGYLAVTIYKFCSREKRLSGLDNKGGVKDPLKNQKEEGNKPDY